jgi:hypothetical protein
MEGVKERQVVQFEKGFVSGFASAMPTKSFATSGFKPLGLAPPTRRLKPVSNLAPVPACPDTSLFQTAPPPNQEDCTKAICLR